MRINSTSKIKKTKVTRKNCKEKLLDVFFWGINPHSNGLNFSKMGSIFFEIKLMIKNKIAVISKER